MPYWCMTKYAYWTCYTEKKKAQRNTAEKSGIRITPTGSNASSSVTALAKSEITWSHKLRNYGIHNKKKSYGTLVSKDLHWM
jgi:hypothetical protein